MGRQSGFHEAPERDDGRGHHHDQPQMAEIFAGCEMKKQEAADEAGRACRHENPWSSHDES